MQYDWVHTLQYLTVCMKVLLWRPYNVADTLQPFFKSMYAEDIIMPTNQ